MPTAICYHQGFVNSKKPLLSQKVKENTLSKFYLKKIVCVKLVSTCKNSFKNFLKKDKGVFFYIE